MTSPEDWLKENDQVQCVLRKNPFYLDLQVVSNGDPQVEKDIPFNTAKGTVLAYVDR